MPVRHYDWIAHYGRRRPKKLTVVDLAGERRFSHVQFDGRTARLATHLRDRLGMARGDRVALPVMNTRRAGVAVRLRTIGSDFPAPEYPLHRARARQIWRAASAPRLVQFVEALFLEALFVKALPRNARGRIHKPTLRKDFGSPDAIDKPKIAASWSTRHRLPALIPDLRPAKGSLHEKQEVIRL